MQMSPDQIIEDLVDELAMGDLGQSKRGDRPEHSAGVIYVFDEHSDLIPYQSVGCRCGWSADPVETSYPDLTCDLQMAGAARAHDPDADTTVGFPLDEPDGR